MMIIIPKVFKILILLIAIFSFTDTKVSEPKDLPRFWTNTGFSPIGVDIKEVLLSSDILTNIDLISSLPNKGLETVRIHWILDLINTDTTKDDQRFENLDKFLDVLVSAGLNLGLEFMSHDERYDWDKDTYEVLRRYTKRYGIGVTSRWKLETWNEPDLKSYNVFNFTLDDYRLYVQDLQKGIKRASEEVGYDFRLRGPAGLFKSKEKHQFCWKILEMCQTHAKCPFDVITFHRKGNGTAESIFSEGISLIVTLSNTFPRLSQIKFSNDEADPIVTWSIPRTFQADVSYAATLVETVLLHWTAIFNDIVNLESISHDNAFLSFYPHQFTQRTLLARFQMNNTTPPHSQFIQKPVFAALGMMGNLGPMAYDMQRKQEWHGNEVTYLSTVGSDSHFYLATILVLRPSTELTRTGDDNATFKLELPQYHGNTTIWYAVEGLLQFLNDPYYYWKHNGSPDYPSPSLRDTLHKLQVPLLLDHDKKNVTSHIEIPLNYLKSSNTSVILIRACEDTIPPPKQVQNIRIKEVTVDEVLILWAGSSYNDRCILTYQIFFRPMKSNKWTDITKDRHVPFMNFQYRAQDPVKTIKGCYKVRSIDIMMQKSEFSAVKCI